MIHWMSWLSSLRTLVTLVSVLSTMTHRLLWVKLPMWHQYELAIVVTLALSPGHTHLFNVACTQKRERAWYQMSRDNLGMLAYPGLQQVCGVQSRLPGYTKRLALCCAVAATCPSWILSTLNFTLHTGDVYHVTSDTRPSPFSACIIEKVRVAWGQGYSNPSRY